MKAKSFVNSDCPIDPNGDLPLSHTIYINHHHMDVQPVCLRALRPHATAPDRLGQERHDVGARVPEAFHVGGPDPTWACAEFHRKSHKTCGACSVQRPVSFLPSAGSRGGWFGAPAAKRFGFGEDPVIEHTLGILVPPQKVLGPSKPTPNTFSEGTWILRDT